VESVNRPGDHMAARRVLARQPTLTPVMAAEGGFDLKTWEALAR
jgi:3-phenylpropionate/trans-cinnamate dioxygenase ferredoxin reductase subunit